MWLIKSVSLKFAIEIVLDETTYYYEFSVREKKIESELLTKKYRRTEKLLEKKILPLYKDIVLRSELKDFENKKQAVKEEALYVFQ